MAALGIVFCEANVAFWGITGEKSAVTEYRCFYQKTHRILASHLRKLGVRDQQDLEDLMQETYVEAFKAISTLKDPEAAMSWLLTIGRRRWIRHLKQTQLRREDHDIEIADFRSPERHIAARSMCHRIMRLLNEIPPGVRHEAINMFYFQGYKLREISQRTGVGVSTLTTWMSRFRRRMQNALEVSEPSGSAPVTSILEYRQRRTGG